MIDIKKEIKGILGSIKNSKIKYKNNGIIIPIYYGYDEDEKLLFDVESMREEVDWLLDLLEDYNGIDNDD